MDKWVVYAAAAAAFVYSCGIGYARGGDEAALAAEAVARRGIKLERIAGPERFALVYYCHDQPYGWMRLGAGRASVAGHRASTRHGFLSPLARTYRGYGSSSLRPPAVRLEGRRWPILRDRLPRREVVLAGFTGWAIGRELALNGRERCDGPSVLRHLNNPLLWQEEYIDRALEKAHMAIGFALEKEKRRPARPGATPSPTELALIAIPFKAGRIDVDDLDLMVRTTATLKRELRSTTMRVLEASQTALVVMFVVAWGWIVFTVFGPRLRRALGRGPPESDQ